MSEFKKGDLVRLKSGGPGMTVVDIGDFGPLGPANGAKCEWFLKEKHFSHVFDVESLISYKPAVGQISIGRG